MSLKVDITKRFKGFTLAVSFNTENDVVGILGASGSGKSMTLKCIAGIETPDDGEIVLNGRVLYSSAQKINLKPQQRRVGYLFQDYALFPHMTVMQNIACGMAGNAKENRTEIERVLRDIGLDGTGGRLPGQLSGGQQQRVALARILASQPEVLLLDEPFSALDSYLKEKMQLQMKETLAKFAGDVLLVTHNRDEVYSLCGDTMVLHDGGVVTFGATKEVFRSPGQTQVARLTGCKNFSKAKKNGEHLVYAVDWDIELAVEESVTDEVTGIGVRAHSLVPSAHSGAQNYIPARILEEAETPFEWNVLFENAAGNRCAPIWWKCGKAEYPGEKPAGFIIPPHEVLLLRD